MALDSSKLKTKLISDMNSVTSELRSKISEYQSEYIKYKNGDRPDEPRAPATPDFIKVISDSVSEYLTENMELKVIWSAVSPASIPDPLIGFNAKVDSIDLGMKKSDVLNLSDPIQFNIAINISYLLGVKGIKIASNQVVNDPIPEVRLTPIIVGTSILSPSIKFGDKSNSGSDAFSKNMEVLADSVVNGLVGPITQLPITGVHGIYESMSSYITEIL